MNEENGTGSAGAGEPRVSYTEYDAAGNIIHEMSYHFSASTPCRECNGSGSITLLTSNRPCDPCNGTGRILSNPPPVTTSYYYVSGSARAVATGEPLDPPEAGDLGE